MYDLRVWKRDSKKNNAEKVRRQKFKYLSNIFKLIYSATTIDWEKFGISCDGHGMFHKEPIKITIEGGKTDYVNSFEKAKIYLKNNDKSYMVFDIDSYNNFKDGVWYDEVVDLLENIVEFNKYRNKIEKKEKNDTLNNEEIFSDWSVDANYTDE